MVQIVLKLADNPSEWSIIELQGFLETDLEELAGLHIGDLHFDQKGTPSLVVGHHVLTGKVASLDKPFAVMKKKKDLLPGLTELMYVDQEDSNTMETSYEVVAFVKQKIIFKNRPRPIIVKTQPIKK